MTKHFYSKLWFSFFFLSTKHIHHQYSIFSATKMTTISQRNIDKHVVRTRSLTKTQYRTQKREVRIKPPSPKPKSSKTQMKPIRKKAKNDLQNPLEIKKRKPQKSETNQKLSRKKRISMTTECSNRRQNGFMMAEIGDD